MLQEVDGLPRVTDEDLFGPAFQLGLGRHVEMDPKIKTSG